MNLFLIIGKSLSGKDTLLKNIIMDKNFCNENNLYKLILYTDRKPRPGEIDGVDYFFVNNLNKNHLSDENIISTEYKSEYGDLHYFINISNLNKDKNYIMVSNPEMLEKIKYDYFINNKQCNLFVIYLIPPNYTLFERFTKRNENSKYDDVKYKEFYRRFIDDLYKFGTNSNRFLSRVPSIINVGENILLDDIKYHIINFIKYGNNNCNGYISSVILNEKYNTCFNQNYYPTCRQKNLKQVLSGKINISNNDIIIDSENETIEFN